MKQTNMNMGYIFPPLLFIGDILQNVHENKGEILQKHK